MNDWLRSTIEGDVACYGRKDIYQHRSECRRAQEKNRGGFSGNQPFQTNIWKCCLRIACHGIKNKAFIENVLKLPYARQHLGRSKRKMIKNPRSNFRWPATKRFALARALHWTLSVFQGETLQPDPIQLQKVRSYLWIAGKTNPR